MTSSSIVRLTVYPNAILGHCVAPHRGDQFFEALAKGLRGSEIVETILSVGRTSAPLLLLLVTAQLYARVLSMTGLTGAAQALLVGSGLSRYEILAIMVLV